VARLVISTKNNYIIGVLRISKKLDYSLIVLVHLASVPRGKLLSARDIADSYGLPLPITAGLLKTLARDEIIRSIRGARGGYVLSIPADKLTLSRIIEAIEGPLELADCIRVTNSRRGRECELVNRCPVMNPIHRLHQTVYGILSAMTLSQLVDGHGSFSSDRGAPSGRSVSSGRAVRARSEMDDAAPPPRAAQPSRGARKTPLQREMKGVGA
jgi:Rrf2 family protein